ncbi:hypothetical protein [Serratia liquefaciens]|uniref:hypothetical protein n=1 Tax=Serratia liquefaciens TaxID=614 RepID=UPI003525E396
MIKSLAEYVVNGGDSASTVTYFLIISFSLFSMLAGSFLKSYVTEKGKNYASKEDINMITEQLKITTETTEQIKNDIQHGAWRKKEVETIKRIKLEEYIRLVARLSTEVNKEVMHRFHNEVSDYDSNLYAVIEGIRILYLPELLQSSIALSESMSKYKRWLADGVIIKSNQENMGGDVVLFFEHCEKYKTILNDLGDSISGVISEVYSLAYKLNMYEK